MQWSVDPGSPVVPGPGYYSEPTRWTYWKPGTSAHSTIMLKGMNQPVIATAPVTASNSSSASVDLRQAFPGSTAASRSVTHGSTSLVIRDVLALSQPVDLVWQWVTDSSVSLGVDRAVLRRNGQSLTLRFIGMPAGSSLEASPAPENGPDGQPLTILKLSMPRIQNLNLTVTAY
ncbi:heparinase II/III domain-containing protein [Arthrobacter sp. SA17]